MRGNVDNRYPAIAGTFNTAPLSAVEIARNTRTGRLILIVNWPRASIKDALMKPDFTKM
jgi:hypothetical protein